MKALTSTPISEMTTRNKTAMGIKKQPMRMCVACRSMREKKMLMRLVKSGDVTVYDATGKMPGRGAYICKSRECVERAKKNRAIERALGVKPDWDALEKELGDDE